MEIKVELEIFGSYEGDSVEERIIDEASRQVADHINDGLPETVQKTIVDELKGKIDTLFSDLVDQPVQETDRWGKPKGEPITLRSFIIAEAMKFLNEEVDGKNGQSPSYHTDDRVRRVEYIARKAIRDEFQAMMKPEIAALKATARAELDELKALLKSRNL